MNKTHNNLEAIEAQAGTQTWAESCEVIAVYEPPPSDVIEERGVVIVLYSGSCCLTDQHLFTYLVAYNYQ